MSFQNKQRIFIRMLALLLTVSVVSVFLAGCQPLRKKFSRKSKVEKKEEFIPVLEPIDYGPAFVKPEEKYSYHYSLWRVWQREFFNELTSAGSEKRQKYLFAQLKEQLGEMRQYLNDEKKTEMDGVLADLEEVEAILQRPSAMRNYTVLRIQFDEHEKKVRNNLKPEVVADKLIEPGS